MSDLAGVVPLNAYAVDVARIADYHAGRFSPAQPHSSAGMKRLRGRDSGSSGPSAGRARLLGRTLYNSERHSTTFAGWRSRLGAGSHHPASASTRGPTFQFLQRPTPAAFGR